MRQELGQVCKNSLLYKEDFQKPIFYLINIFVYPIHGDGQPQYRMHSLVLVLHEHKQRQLFNNKKILLLLSLFS